MKAQMHLAIDLSWTNVETTWREPGSRMGHHYPDIGLFEDIARIAERGLFDMIFSGDSTGIPNTWKGSIEDGVRYGVAWPRLDMSPWIAAMSQVTSHIGFGITYASTFMHPFYVARLLNSLDHLTNGRMAFNVITSQRKADAENYGFDELMEHDQRYDRMDEFIDVCRALWTSVDKDAFKWDRATGVVADPTKVRAIDHVGRFFKVKGPLSVPPSPQVTPVLIQAGGSPRGIRTAARFVDHIFGGRFPIPVMAKQRAAVDEALRAEGRDPDKVGIIWATPIVVGETESEAKATKERLLANVPRDAVGVWLSYNTGFDMSTLPERFSLRELNERIVAANASPVGFVGMLAKEHGDSLEITLEGSSSMSYFVAESEAEANEKYEYLQSLIHPIAAREMLATILGGIDLSKYPLDEPLPDNLPTTGTSESARQNVLDMARRENLTLRQTAMRAAGARGKTVLRGTPKQIVDIMEDWYLKEAADGFNVIPAFLPGSLDDFVELVIPELQRRGLFRKEYTGQTLRDHLGLPRPLSRYAHASGEAAE